MNKDELLRLALEDAKRNERHRNIVETRYWLEQYKLIATQAITAIKAALEAKNEKHIPIEPWAMREEQTCPKTICWTPYSCENGRCTEAEKNVFLSKVYQKEKNT